MKTMIMAVVILSVLMGAGCADKEQSVKQDQVVQETKVYTAYNIWKVGQLLLRRCINYKHGHDIIPAGTEVRKVKIGSDRDGREAIKFTTVKDNREYNIYFVNKWHPGKTIEDYMDYMFTPKNFEELTIGMNETEIEGIQKGIVINGMRKEAVLVAYGYPPEHRTRNLAGNVWVYWKNKFTSFEVCFDKDDRTDYCR
jgi:hypothetical protein